MKNKLSILLIAVLLFSVVSCAKKADIDDPYIDANWPSDSVAVKPDADITNKAETNSDAEKNQAASDINTDSETDTYNDLSQKDTVDEDFYYVSNSNGYSFDYKDVFVNDVSMQWENNIDSFDMLFEGGYGQIIYNGIKYKRYYNVGQQFPARSQKYAGIDFNSLQLSNTKETLWFFTSEPSDKVADGKLISTHSSIEVELYELPQHLATDPYIDVIAVRLPDGQSHLFYNYDKSMISLGTRLELYDAHFGWQCSLATDIESINVTKSNNGQKMTITDTDALSALFSYLYKAEYAEDLDKGKIKFLDMHINFKDGHLIYFNTITTTGLYFCELKTEAEFTEYLDKLFEQ